MTPKHLYRIAIGALILIGCSLCLADTSEMDPYPSADIPIYHKGYKVTQHYNDLTHTKSIVYHVRTEPPAHEVIEFYDAQLNAKGWRSSFEICQRSWEPSSDGETADPHSAHHLFASWQHLGLNLKLDLWIRYEKGHQDHPDEVVVNGLLQPISDQ